MLERKKIIGVIGGAGVQASIEFLSRVEKKFLSKGAVKDSDHPEIIYHQLTQIPSIGEYIEGHGESFVPFYIDAGKKLKQSGADFICMICNTAHYEINLIEKEVGLPVINMVKEVFLFIQKSNAEYKRIGILCSKASNKVNLFQRISERASKDFELIYPPEPIQSCITQGIQNVKRGLHRNSVKSLDSPRYLFDIGLKYLVEQNVDIIILGCTEISLADFTDINSNVKIIDALDVLVDYTFKLCTSDNQYL